MRPETNRHLSPRMHEAVRELQDLITARFPDATFVVEEGFDPEGIYLVATVDIPDTDEVIAVVGDRLVAFQVDEGLPVYVTPLRPIARVVAQLHEREATSPLASLPLG
jgi:hypothetical protein